MRSYRSDHFAQTNLYRIRKLILGENAAQKLLINPAIATIAEQEGLPIGQPAEYDLFHYEHQLPGGMTGTLKNQLKDRGIETSLPAILEEIATIRRELGYPVMATPFSQLIGTQAVMNLMTPGERYKFAPDEIITYVLGHYGKPVAPLDENAKDRILSTPRAKDFVNWTPPQPSLDELRKGFGNVSDDELILRLLVPESALAAMRAAGPPKREYVIRGNKSGPVALIEKLMNQPSGSHIEFQNADFSIALGRSGA